QQSRGSPARRLTAENIDGGGASLAAQLPSQAHEALGVVFSYPASTPDSPLAGQEQHRAKLDNLRDIIFVPVLPHAMDSLDANDPSHDEGGEEEDVVSEATDA
ncbi:hypothetical protein H310_14540, partial [Aphanomyces invadans]